MEEAARRLLVLSLDCVDDMGEDKVDAALKAIEVNGTIDEHQRLHLDAPLPLSGPSRVRVIILIPEQSDLDEEEWLRAAATSLAFDFLKERGEDVYTLSDGSAASITILDR